jgi:hypothetical protein
MNGTKAYRAVYPSIKSDDVAGAAAARLLGNVRVQARIAEIMRAGAERAEVTVEQVVRELKLIGFSDIRKVVSWRNELVTRTEKGKDGEPVLMPRVTIVDADKISDEAAAAVAEVSQTVNGALRVKMGAFPIRAFGFGHAPRCEAPAGHLYSPQRQMGEHRDVLCHHRFGVLLAHSRRAEAEQHFGDGSRKIGGARGGERRLQPIEADLQQAHSALNGYTAPRDLTEPSRF